MVLFDYVIFYIIHHHIQPLQISMLSKICNFAQHGNFPNNYDSIADKMDMLLTITEISPSLQTPYGCYDTDSATGRLSRYFCVVRHRD